jgi:hypothetical protein
MSAIEAGSFEGRLQALLGFLQDCSPADSAFTHALITLRQSETDRGTLAEMLGDGNPNNVRAILIDTVKQLGSQATDGFHQTG